MNLRNLRLGSKPWTIGLIFGIFLAVVLLLYSFVGQVFGSLGIYVSLAIFVIFGVLAGRRASTVSGKISSGMIAGLLTGAIGSLVTSIITLVTVFFSIDAIRQQAQQSANKQHPIVQVTNGEIIQYYIQVLAISVILTTLLSLAGGALGGYFGKGRARLAPAEEGREEVITTATPVQEDDETSSPSYSSNGARRSAASRRSRNARRNRSTN
jgi:hypothetical protein